MASTNLMMLDPLAFENDLYKLYLDISSTISFNFDYPSTEDRLRAAAANLLIYLTYYIKRGKRRAKTPLLAANLRFKVWRTRNMDEETFDVDGKRIKSEKEWYYLTLRERDGNIDSDVKFQILAEGGPRKHKAEVLDAFWEQVENANKAWKSQDEEIECMRLLSENSMLQKAAEAEIARREIARMEEEKGRRAKKRVKFEQMVVFGEEDEDDDDDDDDDDEYDDEDEDKDEDEDEDLVGE